MDDPPPCDPKVMKRPTAASLKKVTPENLAKLGVERLAELLAAVADSRPDFKRRLRMELAAEQGPEHLAAEIDKRLAALQSSRSRVSWRQRPAFLRDLDGLRELIAVRLAGMNGPGALARLWAFIDLARPVGMRLRDREGDLGRVFDNAAADLGRLLGGGSSTSAAPLLVEAMARDPGGWNRWLPLVLNDVPPGLAQAALLLIKARSVAIGSPSTLLRQLADAAGDIEAYRSTYPAEALKSPQVAGEIARRLLAAGRVDAAGAALEAASPPPTEVGTRAPDFDWETAWIEYLERSARGEAAQVARWASFERTLSAERARAFTQRLTGFDDVEAEGRAFDLASTHPDFGRALRFLMDWPALAEAARLIETRPDEVETEPGQAELWAARLRARWPAAALILLRNAAAAAFRRRDFATCDRLTEEAEAIDVPDR